MPVNDQGGFTIETWADLAEHGYQVWATCWRCDRQNVFVDVAALAAEAAAGRRDRQAIPLRLRCRHCGGAGEATIIPPGPFQPKSGQPKREGTG